MDPVALQIGPITIYWYGIIISSAILLGSFLALREAGRQGVDQDKLLNLILIALPVGIIGARAYYVIFNYQLYAGDFMKMIAIWEGGLAIHGGLLGGFGAGYIYTRMANLKFWQLADIFAPSIVLGQAIGRWGNYFNQEAYGYVTDLPWAMYIDGAYRHPTFLYEFIWNLGVFGILLWMRKKKDYVVGEIFLAYAILYSVGRFFIEGFRTDSLMIGPLRTAQLISIIIIVVATAAIYIRRKMNSNKGKA
ncbi:phosphatidylglycerol:prolipoprotein diacylglycerol transferase [Desulfitispora alkaliphila]|uniref:prolipoprotein diacylglyceryl transferase n=1 Tax=Desulfitispora alkaliphila TaxID=622674 RepID=UPI003D1AB5C4